MKNKRKKNIKTKKHVFWHKTPFIARKMGKKLKKSEKIY